jgi:hypothetical protein
MDEQILREWIEKAKPLVDSAWNLALDEAIRVLKSHQTINGELDFVIVEVAKLKKDTQ